MRVGIVSFADIESGLDLANILSEAGHSVTVYLSYSKVVPLLGDIDNLEGRLYDLKLIPPECKVRIFRFPRIRDPRSLGVVLKMRRQIAADQLDIAHLMIGPLELWPSILALFLGFLPVLSTIIIPIPNVGEAMPSWIEITINRLAVLGSQMIIVNGEKLITGTQKVYKISRDRIVHVPLAPRVTVPRWLGSHVQSEPHTVLFIGRALPHKGLEYLIAAEPIISSRIPDVKIVIAVHGDQVNYWKGLLEGVRGNPRYEIHEGFMPGDVMAAYYARSSVVVLPYVSASTSGVLLDAYSFGKPVVATEIGSFPEYVENGITGLLIPPADVESLAEAIVKILSNDPLRECMGKNARVRIEKSRDEIAIIIMDTYKKAIQRYKESH